jgi:16S rRNA (uracil1498-N3)-methyltransferase
MSDRYFSDTPLHLGSMSLTGSEAHHLLKVCRAKVGDTIQLFHGDGREYRARIVHLARQSIELEVLSFENRDRELPQELVVAAPLPKGDREPWLIEKLTELGTSRFVPLRTSRSVVHPTTEKLGRLTRYVIEASKQCGRNRLMGIEPLCAWGELLRRDDLPATRLLAHPGGGPFPALPMGPVLVACGPEGGLTDDEVEQARTAGWQVVGLGSRILRMDTAAVTLAVLATARNLLSS